MKLLKQPTDEMIQDTVEIMSTLDKVTKKKILGYAEFLKYEKETKKKNKSIQIVQGGQQ